VPGWQADLTRQAEGRITARRSAPLPTAELRVVFQP
jgi:outer membrane lipoprotein LolB